MNCPTGSRGWQELRALRSHAKRVKENELPDSLARVAGIEGVKIACQEGEGKYAKSE